MKPPPPPRQEITPSAQPAYKKARKKLEAPLYMGYYRTWHDRWSYLDDDAASQMSDIPAAVDVVFVFHSYTADDSPFWQKLRDVYVPKLNNQGTWVVRTVGIRFIDGRDGVSKTLNYEKDETGWKLLAKAIVAEYVDKCNLDGLDIDFEKHDSSGMNDVQKRQAVAVITEVGKILRANGKLLILDTNKEPNDPDNIFQSTKTCYDYILQQNYGSTAYTTTHFTSYADYVDKHKLLTGFSFYEENDHNNWLDVPSISIVADDNTNALKEGVTVEALLNNDNFKNCKAYKMALWTAQNKYGGCFSYAIERDGVRHGNDKKFFKVSEGGQPSQYLFSQALKELMKKEYKK